MAKLQIASVGFESPDPNVEHVEFRSAVSLLDYDLIMIRTSSIGTFSYETYEGKYCLDDDHSFQYRDLMTHWRREINASLDGGKNVIVFLGQKVDIHIASGEKKYSGTGRNQRVTRIVEPYDNFKFIPVSERFVESIGSSMRLTERGAPVLSEYWEKFEVFSKYNVFMDGEVRGVALTTKNGGRAVGAIHQRGDAKGALVLLPDLNFDDESLNDEDEDGDHIWTESGIKFFHLLTQHVVGLDKKLKARDDVTPEPDWVSNPLFRLPKEEGLINAVAKIQSEMELFQGRLEQLNEELEAAKVIKGLLFEKGKPLEAAVIQGLSLLGYEANSFRSDNTEFDVIFSAPEGRLLGEVEGKDNKPVNITKLRQISMNVHEDFEREDVERPAKGVLFGNAFRLQELEGRGEPFTEKCLSASSVGSIALVYTPDLYRVVRHTVKTGDEEFARACRNAIMESIGRVQFPAHTEDYTVEELEAAAGEVVV